MLEIEVNIRIVSICYLVCVFKVIVLIYFLALHTVLHYKSGATHHNRLKFW